MADALMPYLEKLLDGIEKDVTRFKAKGDEAMFLKPTAEWTEADWKRFDRTPADKMFSDSQKWMARQIEAEFAARELRDLIFLRKLTRGH